MISVHTRTQNWSFNAERWVLLAQDPARAAWWSAYAIFQSAGIVVCVRRLLGWFEQPLPALHIVLVSILAAALCVLLKSTPRVAGLSSQGEWREPLTIAIWLSLTAQAFLLLLAISLPDTSVVGLVTSWAILVGAQSSWWTRCLSDRCLSLSESSPLSSSPSPFLSPSPAPSPLAAAELSSSDEDTDELWPDGVTQQSTRLENELGGETIAGGVRVDFAAGERQRIVHLGVCPPMNAPPQFHVEQSEGAEAHVDVTQCEPFGVRLEVKLVAASSEPQRVVLQYELIGSL